MKSRVVTDDVDHGHLALARVVQVRQVIAQAAAQAQQRGGGLVGHACVAIGRAGGHAFEQCQHRDVNAAQEPHLFGVEVSDLILS